MTERHKSQNVAQYHFVLPFKTMCIGAHLQLHVALESNCR